MRHLALLTVLLAIPTTMLAQESDNEWLAHCQSGAYNGRHTAACVVQVKTIPARSLLSVEPGQNGAVLVESYDGHDIEVHARMQASGSSRNEASALLNRVQIDLGKTISASGPDDGSYNWSVSFVLFVPRTTNLDVSTENGPIAVRNVVGNMDLRTTNGPIGLRGVGGDVHARATNGPIDVSLTGERWNGAGLDAYTDNGPISLELPARYNAVLETGTTNGPVESDFPINVSLNGRNWKHFTTTLGQGGPRVRVVTTNGPVRLGRP